MKKSTSSLFFCGVLIIVVSQWLSNMWLSHSVSQRLNEHTAESSLSTTHSLVEHMPQESVAIKNNSQSDVDVLVHALAPMIEQKIQVAMKQVSADIIANHASDRSTLTNTLSNAEQEVLVADTVVSSTVTETAYYDVLDVVLDAQSRGVWDNSVSMRIAENANKITIKQQQEIIGEYMKALQEGIVGRDVVPPF